MTKKRVYLFAQSGFADWEPAHALAELRRHGKFEVRVVGLSSDPVQSMGGLCIRPDMTIGEVDPADVAVLIVPGGDSWEREVPDTAVLDLLVKLDQLGVPIAAICAATTVIARAGLLRGRKHTSNSLEYLKHHVSAYVEDANYVDAPAVRDCGLVTASGLADVEFAREVMAELGVLNDELRGQWTALFRSGRMPAARVET